MNNNPIVEFYRILFEFYGPQDWWPGDTAFEIIVGAILTQNTNWTNVEKALENLKVQRRLTPERMFQCSLEELAELIRPSGYFNVKAKRLRNFLTYLNQNYQLSLEKLAAQPTKKLREELLSINGIGPETADSILLYAFGHQVFVIDAYTKRLLYRHGLVDASADYHRMQNQMISALVGDTQLYNEYHALIVRLGKDYCRPKPDCDECPLNRCYYSVDQRCPRCYRQTVDTSVSCSCV